MLQTHLAINFFVLFCAVSYNLFVCFLIRLKVLYNWFKKTPVSLSVKQLKVGALFYEIILQKPA